MANPFFIECEKNQWTLVCSNVTTGKLWRARVGANYLHTYRDSGDPAPTERGEGMQIFTDNEPNYEIIKSNIGIDVYIYPVNKNGRVRVDL